MKREREEEKMAGPLFPRLHVNDADKGGPRAPPRNKMALYEQFSIPSQRFASSSSSTLPGPPHHGSGLVPSTSSNQSCIQERSVSSSYHLHPHKPHSHSRQRAQSSSTEGSYPKATRAKHPRVAPTARRSPADKSEEDDFRVPVYVQRITERQVAERELSGEGENPESLPGLAKSRENIDPCGSSDTSSNPDHETGPSEGRFSGDAELADAEKSGSSGSTDKIYSSGDGTTDCRAGDDSDEGMDITPDNVVGLIGAKHFWKARRAITNQQRVFDLQVFELHRLTNVQKLLASSPHLLLDDASSFHRSSANPAKSQPVDCEKTVKSGQREEPSKVSGKGARLKDKKDAPLQEEESAAASLSPPPPPPPTGPANEESKPGPWCVHLAGNHWLVPVMSPTEGLIYKPFPAGNPPAGGAPMAPIYKPQNMMLVPGAAPGFMAAPPYGLRPPGSGSEVDQASFFSGGPALPPRESDLQSSTASSTTRRAVPPAAVLTGERSARVIKVVPRNPKSASESAVRIFQSIQKERQAYDPLQAE